MQCSRETYECKRTARKWAALLLGTCLLASGCTGGGKHHAAPKSDVLKLAFFFDMAVPDPDIFYEVEGSQVVTSVYEGLLRYKPGPTVQIEPWLAKSYSVSSDSLSFVFKLRPDIKFHDGTALDSAAVKYSFERRTKVNSGSAYMLADVSGYEAPDPRTFVVRLKRPVSAFLDYLASPYSPKVVSPTAVRAHEIGGDLGKGWLKSHDAGTGPFGISRFNLGQQYVLSRFDGYWGQKSDFKSVEISIVPVASQQQIQLQGGDLDELHQQPIDTIQAFRSARGLKVVGFPSFLKMWLHLNPNKGLLADKQIRRALGSALDRKALVNQVFQGTAKVSTSMYPAAMPSLNAPDDYTYNPRILRALVAQRPARERSLTITYATGQVYDQRMADAIQGQLTPLGIRVQLLPKPLSDIFGFVAKSPKTLPDIFIETTIPDAAHPDTWSRIFMYTGGGLNFLHASVPAADAEMDRGLRATSQNDVAAAYSKAGQILHEDASFITLADVSDTFVLKGGFSGVEHQVSTPFCLVLGSLRR